MERVFVGLCLIALLGGCAPPRQTCEAGIDRDLGTLDAQIEEAGANIARGYALEPDPARTITFGACSGNGRNGYRSGNVGITICGSREIATGTRPVAIDLGAERAKLADLQRQRAAREAAIAEALAQCSAAYPE